MRVSSTVEDACILIRLDGNSNAGGGGERVLWTAITLMQRTEPDVISVVYSGDMDTSKEQIIAKAKVRLFSFHARNAPALIILGRSSAP
jgi:hypothetical protein